MHGADNGDLTAAKFLDEQAHLRIAHVFCLETPANLGAQLFIGHALGLNPADKWQYQNPFAGNPLGKIPELVDARDVDFDNVTGAQRVITGKIFPPALLPQLV